MLCLCRPWLADCVTDKCTSVLIQTVNTSTEIEESPQSITPPHNSTGLRDKSREITPYWLCSAPYFTILFLSVQSPPQKMSQWNNSSSVMVCILADPPDFPRRLQFPPRFTILLYFSWFMTISPIFSSFSCQILFLALYSVWPVALSKRRPEKWTEDEYLKTIVSRPGEEGTHFFHRFFWRQGAFNTDNPISVSHRGLLWVSPHREADKQGGGVKRLNSLIWRQGTTTMQCVVF